MKKVGVVDIGTNSMRLLVTSAEEETGRWDEVTGLGRGVDASGRLGEEGISASLSAFQKFAVLLDHNHVDSVKAIATSACRDAANREDFFDRVEAILGVRPTLITGEEEARYAFAGAAGAGSDALVSDIGGGSTEFVTAGESRSVQVGSVRLTDRILGDSPATPDLVESAHTMVSGLFAGIGFQFSEIIGVAGTWTSLAAIVKELNSYKAGEIHGSTISAFELRTLIDQMTTMTLDELKAIPSLDPGRAPVILGGAIVAEGVLNAVGAERAKISKRDTLDGVAAEMLT